MDRRAYLATVTGLSAGALAGCSGYLGGEDGTAPGDSAEDTSTAEPSVTETAASNQLAAGSHVVTLTEPRVRPSIRHAGVHVDVRAERGSQFLVVDCETRDTRVDQLPAMVVADGRQMTERLSLVGRPDGETAGTIGFPIPVSDYERVAVVMETDGDSARWQVPNDVVATLARAPEFAVGDIEVPDSVPVGETFTAAFTVTNDGNRDARFLAEFGHTLISDTGEVEVTVPAGERRTHTSTIDPYYESETTEVPVLLDWGIDTRHATTTVEREMATTALPPRSDALRLDSSYPIDGTMVNVGVGGTARNAGDVPLINCVIVASGDVGERRFSAIARRDRLDVDQTWAWEVAFGDVADTQREPVRNIEVETRAEPAR